MAEYGAVSTVNKAKYVEWGSVALFNMTPHNLVVLNDQEQEIVVIPSCGVVARVNEDTKVESSIEGLQFLALERYAGDKTTMPSQFPMHGAWSRVGFPLKPMYIVSMVFASNADIRRLAYPTLYVPGPVVKGKSGQPVGCKGLIRYERATL